MSRLDGDMVVGLLGLCMALLLVSRSSALARLSTKRKVGYAAAWAVIIGVLAAFAERFTH